MRDKKNKMIGLSCSGETVTMSSRFDKNPKREGQNGQTDRQTDGRRDGQICYINNQYRGSVC